MGEVVRLPTAAPRKVRYCQTKAERAAKARLPQFPDRFIYSGVRAKAAQARALVELERTPELVIASALFQALDTTQKMRTQIFAAAFAESGGGKRACAWLRILAGGRSVGEDSDLQTALELVKEGRL